MSAARTRPAVAIVAFVVAALTLSACAGQTDPDDWSASVKKNFVASCDGSAAAGDPVKSVADELKANAQSTKVCQCVVDNLEKNVDFDDLKSFNSRNREADKGDKQALNDKFAKTGKKIDAAYTTCLAGEKGEGEAAKTTTTEKTTASTEAPATSAAESTTTSAD